MIGFVEADLDALSEAQRQRYRGAYCGLCRALHDRSGELCRLTLNYDMVFLVLLLNSMYEPEQRSGHEKCLIHPLRGRDWLRSRFTDYAADVSVILAYHKLLDDWQDDRNLLTLGGAELLKRRYESAASRWPVQRRTVEDGLAELGRIERADGGDPDAAANCFGALMGALFLPEPDPLWGERMRSFGTALGRFIYMMDACVDLEKDKRRGRYNPLVCVNGGVFPEEERLTLLKILIGECTEEFERLPLVQDVEILRSVLYSGVWRQFREKTKKKKRGADDEQRPV